MPPFSPKTRRILIALWLLVAASAITRIVLPILGAKSFHTTSLPLMFIDDLLVFIFETASVGIINLLAGLAEITIGLFITGFKLRRTKRPERNETADTGPLRIHRTALRNAELPA